MKIAIFWDKAFDNNNFRNLEAYNNVGPFLEMANINGIDDTISLNLLEERRDKEEFVIFCFLTFSMIGIVKYIKMFWKYPKNTKYLFLFEPPVVAPLGYMSIWRIFFDRIYTWNDTLVDNKKYYKYIWPQSYVSNQDPIPFTQKKMIVLMNANKFSLGRHELYSLREKIIRFFEAKNVGFDLYGPGWGKPNLKQKLLGFTPFSSWKGRADDKIATIGEYKFNICFENMCDTPGYITEKIWDSFKAKTIPVYWGASNIEDYVPKNCYIDYRDFLDFEKLYTFLSKMTEIEYNTYIENIELFLETKDAKRWFDYGWAKYFIQNM